jgi:hypothetical protein
MTACQTSLLVPLLAKSQELPVSQLARHVDRLHLVITDNWKSETLSLPHGIASPIKPTTNSSQATAVWTWKSDNPAVWPCCSAVPHIWCQNPEEVNRMLQPGAGPLAFVSCPLPNPDCWTDPTCLQTESWTLLPWWISHPSLASLPHCSPPDLLLRLGKCHPLPGLPALLGPEVMAPCQICLLHLLGRPYA